MLTLCSFPSPTRHGVGGVPRHPLWSLPFCPVDLTPYLPLHTQLGIPLEGRGLQNWQACC